ncbi:hypothetical protein [Mycolicibacter kumamotonensis]|uniref:hypothetical protein n=1 Tax=Mycolicibacter kumamotonensis TaxID=354243 RepID=UPI001056D46B|nr:hypothetical protein [Mycolicibacter kumamotonensis]
MPDFTARITEILRDNIHQTDLDEFHPAMLPHLATLISAAAKEHYRPQLDVALIERMAQAIWDEMRPYKDWSKCPDKHVYRHAARGVFRVLWSPGAGE